MRVLLVANTAASMVWFRLPLLRALRARGHRVWVAAPEDRGVERILETGASFVPLSKAQGWSLDAPRGGSYLDATSDLQTLRDLRRVCRVIRPDLMLSYTAKLTLLGALAGRATGVPHVHGMVTGLGWGSLATGARGVAVRAAFHMSLGLAARLSDSLILLNPDNLDEVRRHRVAPPHKLFLVDGEGVDTSDWDAPAPAPEGPPTFLMVGRLVHHKGAPAFVEAARRARRRHPGARFVLAGGADPTHPDAVDPDEVERWRREGVVELTGHVEDVRALYRQADVVVLPSAAEGLPMSLMEAMAMRRPIIATAVSGCRETVAHGVNGWLVPFGDDDALAGAMIEAIEEPARLTGMGEASRARCLERFDHRVVNERLLAHLAL